MRTAPGRSHDRVDVHNSLGLDIELGSLQQAHFFDRANIDNGCFPSNRFDKATHVRSEQIRSPTEDQNTRQKKRVSSDAFRFHITVLFSTHSPGAINTSLRGNVRINDSDLLKFVARTSTGFPAIHAERSIDS